jgi:outer membrane protein TolC
MKFYSVLSILTILGLAGCASTSNSETRAILPMVDVPALAKDWYAGDADQKMVLPATDFTSRDWADPTLLALQALALENNKDLRVSAQRIRTARAEVSVVRGMAGVALDTTLSVRRSKLAGLTGQPVRNPTNQFSSGVDLAYELDLWGRLDAQMGAANADLIATTLDRTTMARAVSRDVANHYFAWHAASYLMVKQRALLNVGMELAQIQLARLEFGTTDGAEVVRAHTDLRSAEDEMANFLRDRNAAVGRLAVLTAISSHDVDAILEQAPVGSANCGLCLTLPSVVIEQPLSVLSNRPDLRSALARFNAVGFRLDEAEASRYPKITIATTTELLSDVIHKLVRADSFAWSLVPRLTAPLFDSGQRSARIEQNTARHDEARAEWGRLVVRALGEVEEAFGAYRLAQRHLAVANARIRDGLRLHNIVLAKFSAGRVSKIEILQSQQQQLQSDIIHARATLAQLDAALQVQAAQGLALFSDAAIDVEKRALPP